jgi:hypothetical protein
MSTALNNNQPTSVVVTSLTSGSVVVNSMLVYDSSTLNSTSMTSIITSSIQTAAASSSSFPVIANSLSVTVTSSVAINGMYLKVLSNIKDSLIYKLFI